MREKMALEFNRIWYKYDTGEAWIIMANKATEIITGEIEKGLLTKDERMSVYIPCETCPRIRDFGTVECLDCVAIEHEKAQLQKILSLLK